MRRLDPAARMLICVVCCASVPTQAQNLLQNPGFDHDLSGWDHMLYVSHVSDDGWPAPGAMRLSSSFCCTQEASQCIPVVGGARYEFGAAFKLGPVAPGQAGDGIGIDIFWHTSADCSGPTLPGAMTLAPDVSTSWDFHLVPDLPAPATAGTALLRVRQYNFAALTGMVSFADSVIFQLAPVFRDGFEPPPE
jgi:hypothetical protein